MKKILPTIGMIGMLFIVVIANADHEEHLSQEVEDILNKRISLATNELAQNPSIIKALKESNVTNKNLSLEEKLSLDKKWRTSKSSDEFIKKFLSNECAEHLIEFQDTYDGYPEIFIADTHGLNACQTNKTTDYYQADEDWWVKGYNKGQGLTFHGELEYDESAMSEAIPVIIPILDPETKKALGVMKVIIDILSIKMEL